VTETELLRRVEQLCRRHDVWWWHGEVSLRDRRGMPDLVLAGTRAAAVRELKSARGALSPEQREVSQRMAGAGWDFAVWRPADLDSGRIEAEIAALSGRTPWTT
jgi:hypothetical protein